MWPAMAARVRAMLDTPAGKIRGPEKLDADMKKQIEDGSPEAGDRARRKRSTSCSSPISRCTPATRASRTATTCSS